MLNSLSSRSKKWCRYRGGGCASTSKHCIDQAAGRRRSVINPHAIGELIEALRSLLRARDVGEPGLGEKLYCRPLQSSRLKRMIEERQLETESRSMAH